MGKLSRLLLIVCASLLAACSSEASTVEVTRIVTEIEGVEVTREVEVTRVVEVTRIVETELEKVITRPVEVTRLVVATVVPEPTEVVDASVLGEDLDYSWALNYLGTAESAGVTIELGRVAFIYRDTPDPRVEGIWDDFKDFDEAYGVGEYILKITNDSESTVIVNGWDDGFAQINDEQISFDSLEYRYQVLEEPIFPGSTVIAHVSFPIMRTDIADITSVKYYSGEIWEADTYRELGSRIIVSADITEQIWEDEPEEFKNY